MKRQNALFMQILRELGDGKADTPAPPTAEVLEPVDTEDISSTGAKSDDNEASLGKFGTVASSADSVDYLDSLLNSPRDYKHKAPAHLQTSSVQFNFLGQFLELTKQEQALMKRQNALFMQILRELGDGKADTPAPPTAEVLEPVDTEDISSTGAKSDDNEASLGKFGTGQNNHFLLQL